MMFGGNTIERRGFQVPHRVDDIVVALRHLLIEADKSKGSFEASEKARQALMMLWSEIGQHLDWLQVLTPAVEETADVGDLRAVLKRSDWQANLDFIEHSFAFPGLKGLALVLHELGRGVVAPELEPRSGGRRGGLSDTGELQRICAAANAADRLQAFYPEKVEAFKAALESCGTSYSTIQGYRKKRDKAHHSVSRNWLPEGDEQAARDALLNALRALHFRRARRRERPNASSA